MKKITLFLLVLLASLCLPIDLRAQSVGPISITGGLGNCATISTLTNTASVGINIAGSWTGTIQPQGTIQGQAAFNTQVTPSTSSTAQSTITANGAYVAAVSGFSTFQVCGNTITGTAVIYLNGSQAQLSASSVAAGSVAFSGITSGTNSSAAMVVGTGASLIPSGTGTLASNQVLISSTIPGLSPSPLATAACPSGQNVFEYISKSGGTYQDTAFLDVTTVSPPATPAGTINHCWRTWFNGTGVAMPGMKNRMVGIAWYPGQGGISTASGTLQASALGVLTETLGTDTSFSQLLTSYMEMQLDGTPTFTGTAAGEDNASTGRFNFTDNRTGGTAAGKMAAVHGVMFLNSTSLPLPSCGNGNCWIGVQGSVYDLLGGARSSTFYEALRGDGSNTGGCTSCGFLGLHAVVPPVRFPSGTFGIVVDNFGTNASDYDMALGGVNASGTPAGYWSATGPGVLGAQAHAAAGVQLDIRGGNLALTNGLLSTYNGITTAGLGVPVQVARVRSVAQTSAIGTTTLYTTGSATSDYLLVATVYCTTTSAAATVAPTFTYTDTGSATQTITPTAAACTALGASSFDLVNTPITVKNGTNIQYSTAIVNTPTYDLRIGLYQLGVN